MTFQRLTIDDVARIAGVSRTTASMVLNGHAERYRIAQATVERVEQVARELHFSPSHSARSLRNRRSQAIGLVIPDLTNASHAALAQALENLCRARDLQGDAQALRLIERRRPGPRKRRHDPAGGAPGGRHAGGAL